MTPPGDAGAPAAFPSPSPPSPAPAAPGEPPELADPAWRRWSPVVGIDLRSLAAFRVAAALLLLADLALRARDLGAHYSDDGVLPRLERIGIYELAAAPNRQMWSLHLVSGEAWAQALLLLLAALYAFRLLVGYRTRASAVASWILLASLHARNPLLQSFGDAILSCLLFWAMFAPLGAVGSLDARRGPPRSALPPRALSLATAALLLQPFLLYVLSAAYKTGPVWSEERSAVYYALELDRFATPFGRWLAGFPRLLPLLTSGVLLVEAVVPFLALSPWRSDRLRLVAVATFWTFHAGLGLAMALGLFPFIACAAWLLYLPSSLWDRLEPRLAPVRRRWGEAAAALERTRLFRAPAPARLRPRRGVALLLGLLLLGEVAWHVESLRRERAGLPPSPALDAVRLATGVLERWRMFAEAQTMDGWYVMRGRLRDGSEVNLWEPGRALPWTKPASVSGSYRRERWRNYLVHVARPAGENFRGALAGWLRRRWDRERAGGDPARRVARVELHFLLERTPPPGFPVPPARDVLLFALDVPAERSPPAPPAP